MSDKIDREEMMRRSNALFDLAASTANEPHLAVKWGDPQRQYFRFAELIKYVDLDDPRKTLLDVGCGNGELLKFLNFSGYRGQYRGCDINAQLLEQARKRFPGAVFEHRDLLSAAEEFPERFDYVLMSGLFNADFGQSVEWVHLMLAAMFRRAEEVLAFNAVSTHVNTRDREIFYLDPSSLLEFCIKNLSKRVTVAHHNLPFNFTAAVYRDENWRSV